MYDPSEDGGNYGDTIYGGGGGASGSNWWEQPAPAWYHSAEPWPPPLPPGAHYGPNPGSVIYAQPSANPDTDPNFQPYDPNDPAHGGPLYHPQAAAPVGNQNPTPAGSSTSPGAAAGPTIGGLLAPFQPPVERYGFPTLPQFHAPVFKGPDAFADPTMEEVESDPGYEFGRKEGQRALEASKASQGVYNTGGTLKDLLAWGNNYATQRYGDVRNRKMDTYQTNYKTQYLDPFEKLYRGALDEFAPQMTGFSTEAAWNQRANEDDWQHAWDTFRDQRDSTYNKVYQYSTS